MKKIILKNIKKVHFIGIGGIGVSAIARMFLARGVQVSGSDESPSEITEELKRKGAKIYDKHKAENINKNTDLIVYTIAIDQNNPEFVEAKKQGIKTTTYSQMLGIISEGYYTVAVSGTHGKTTTTAMIAKAAIDTGLDPTVIVGSLLKDSRSNLIIGNSNLSIIEACEYKRSFLDLNPNILVITNIDEDHLDYYRDITDIQSAFIELVGKLGPDDFVVCNPNDPKVAPVLKNAKCKIINCADSYEKITPKLELKVIGKYNQENAEMAFSVLKILKVKKDKAYKSLSEFEGVWRRFEYKGKMKIGALVYDDYAHHPTEIMATLGAVREKFKGKKIITVFQPHLYSRTKLLLNELSKSFSNTDKLILAPIYAAREVEDASISSRILAKTIKKNDLEVLVFNDFDEIERHIRENTQKDDIILTMGAGDIFKIGENLLQTNV